MEQRILVLAPRGRDAEVIAGVVGGLGMHTQACSDQAALTAALREGAAAAVLTEEAVGAGPEPALGEWLRKQPPWSDLPFVVLATRQTARRSDAASSALHRLGNVVLLERPLNADTLASAVDAAVRARRRQYATRRHLEELQDTRDTVEQLNRRLEKRIELRTRELAGANDRLTSEMAERERAQGRLLQAQKMDAIGRLTGGIAHDFNNLLHVVGINLDMLARMVEEPRMLEMLASSKRAVTRGAKLTGQLLSFARAQSLTPRRTQVDGLLLGIQELIAVSLGTSIRPQYALGAGMATTLVDPNQLEMAVLNLCVNAKDAMPSGGTLEIATRVSDGPRDAGLPAGRYVVLSVADTGTGIAPALLNKVFDPFFTTKPIGSGTGLGLSQVYGFAQQSGGLARIASVEGEGTTVTLWFPLVGQAEADADPCEEEEPAPGGRYSILVVEDDAEVRRTMVESLELNGNTVSAAADGLAALHALEQQAPELMIVDYAMPGMNGAELIGRVRHRWPRLPIILASGYADMSEVGRLLGTHSILAKPFQIPTLLKAVEQAMRTASRPLQ